MSTMIAKTILEQLGGNKFIVMTGAKNFMAAKAGLHFHLPTRGVCAKNRARYVHIDLDLSTDTYTVKFMRLKKFDVVTISEHSLVHAEDLRNLFTEQTGLETSLGSMRGAA